jgi:phosphomannomutase/phosphoglucomutase
MTNKTRMLFKLNLQPEQDRMLKYLLLAFLLSVLVLIVLWKLVIAPINKNQVDEGIQALLENQQIGVSQFIESVNSTLTSHVFDERVQQIVSENRNAEKSQWDTVVFELQKKISESIPNTQSVRFYQIRQAQKEKESGGNIGFVELDMINRAELNETVFPEVSVGKDSNDWKMHWAIPVFEARTLKDEQRLPQSVLYVSTTLTGLEASVASFKERAGQLQIVQTIGRQRVLKFFSKGNTDSSTPFVKKIPNSHWQMVFTPSKKFAAQAAYIPIWFYAIAAILFTGSGWFARKMAIQKNQQAAALYKTLDMGLGKKTEIEADQEKSGEDDSNQTQQDTETFDDPLYLSDEEFTVEEGDMDLIAGMSKTKEHGSEVKGSLSGSVLKSTGTGLLVPRHIFRAYDIRGIAMEEITPEIAEAVGRAVATETLEQGENTLLIGHDVRTHSPSLCEHLKVGVLSTGCDVIFMGVIPTPLLNFATVFSDKTSSGIIVTASHNPKDYNGFKIAINEQTLVGSDIERLRDRIEQGAFAQSETEGSVVEEDFSEDYIDTIAADIAINSGYKIVVDAANGTSSEIAPTLFKELGCEVVPLFCEFDGEFPNHDPDPSVEANLQSLIDKVQESEASLGFAFDGDADRLMVVTGSGKVIWPDQLLMLFAKDVVSRNPGCDVIFDVKSTRMLNQIISSYGGRPVMWKTGHSHIKAKMRETNALLAGEFSGHIFFKERWFGFDDGMYAACRLLEILSLRDQSLDELLESIPESFATPEIKVVVDEEDKFQFVDQLSVTGDFSPGEKTIIDGLRVDFAKGWGLVRASNTSAALTLRFEADSEGGLDQLKTLFKRELKKLDESLVLDF